MREEDDGSICSYNSGKTKKRRDRVKNSEITFIKEGGFSCGYNIVDNTGKKRELDKYIYQMGNKRIFAKEVENGKILDSYTSKISSALNQAYYSFITNTPNIYGIKKDEDREFILYQYAKEGKNETNMDGDETTWDANQKQLDITQKRKLHDLLHAAIHGANDRRGNTRLIGENKYLGYDIDDIVGQVDNKPELVNMLFCKYQMDTQNIKTFLNILTDTNDEAKEIISEEIEKIKNIDYQAFVRRAIGNMKAIGIEPGRKEQSKIRNFLIRALAYKQDFLEQIEENYKTGGELKIKYTKSWQNKLSSSYYVFIKKIKNALNQDIKKIQKILQNDKWFNEALKPKKSFWGKLIDFAFGCGFEYNANNDQAARNLRSGNFYENQR